MYSAGATSACKLLLPELVDTMCFMLELVNEAVLLAFADCIRINSENGQHWQQ